ncbi:hypothetical protein AK812_SmicGene46069, partial [Symbiodinium microadriaticum]
VRLQLTGECDRAMRTLRLRDMRQVAHKLVVALSMWQVC